MYDLIKRPNGKYGLPSLSELDAYQKNRSQVEINFDPTGDNDPFILATVDALIQNLGAALDKSKS